MPKKEKMMLYRDFTFSRNDVDVEKRTINLTFSSEFRVERPWGIEILDHSPESVRMDRMNSGAVPFLVMHDRNKLVGVIEQGEISPSERKGHALARFGKSDYAEEIFQDVLNDIRKTVSVAYREHEFVLEKHSDNEPDEWLITDWEPIEISLEPTPADYSVGVGRSLDEFDVKIIDKKRVKEMKEDKKEPIVVDRTDPQPGNVDVEKVRADAAKTEKERIREIYAIADNFDMRDEAAAAVQDGTSVEDFQKLALNKLKEKKHIDAKPQDLGLTPNEVKEYSFMNAVRAILTDDFSKAGFELECSDQIAKMRNEPARPNGFIIPHDILNRNALSKTREQLETIKRELTISGSALLGTDHLAASFIDVLRNKAALPGLGALMLTGLVGNVSIPKQSGAATAYWVAESGNVTTSDPTFTSVTLDPKTVGANTLYSRKMLLQSNPSIEALVMNDLASVLGLAIDLAGIAGTGTSNQPTGIVNTTGIGAVDGSSLNWEKVVEFETDVAASNADIGSMFYLTNATIVGILKTREKASNTAKFLAENGEVNGYPLAKSNQVPAANMIFGVFSQLIIGMWGGLDILIDKFTSAADGGVYIRAFQDVDVAVRHAAAFSAATNVS